MNNRIANDLIRYAELVEDGALISPEEMNCASVMRLAAEYLAQPEQEPVAWDGDCVLGHCGSPAGCEASNCCRADSTAPPQHSANARKPLTDEQMLQALNHFSENPSEYRYSDPLICFARAIEAAHNIHPTGFKE